MKPSETSKYTIIQGLVSEKKEKDKLLTLATTEKTASEKTLANKTAISENDKAELTTAEANQNVSDSATESVKSLLEDINTSFDSSLTLHKEVSQMVEDAHQTLQKATSFVLVIEELNTYINNEVKHNKIILNLLVKDSAKAVLDAKTAVTLAAKALVDSITAAGSVVQLSKSLEHTQTLIKEAQPLLADKTTGIDHQLEILKSKSQKLYDQSLKDKKDAEQALRNVIKKFNDATIEANAATKALDAANAAVGQAA